MPTAKTDDLSPIPRAYMVEEEKLFSDPWISVTVMIQCEMGPWMMGPNHRGCRPSLHGGFY